MTDNDVRRIEDKVDNVALVLAKLEGSLAPSLQKLAEDQDDTARALREHEIDTARRFEKHDERITVVERFRLAFPSVAFLALVVACGTLAYYLISAR